ncbi:hypothetical protein L7F22_059531 [Adiantum nelumboides]|nr:hypothetical protein [Adiantum nelumboides]
MSRSLPTERMSNLRSRRVRKRENFGNVVEADQRRKRESFCNVMEADQRSKGKEPLKIQKKFPLRKSTRRRSPPDKSDKVVANMVTMEMLERMEAILESKLQQQVEKMGSKMQLMYTALREAGKSTYLSQTPAELGLLVKENAEVRDDCVPSPVDGKVANHIWGSQVEWDSLNDPSVRILEEKFNKMLQKVKWHQCKQEMVFTGHAREELSDQKQIDYTIYIKGKCHVASNVTGLVSLYSFPDPGKHSKRSKYNCKAHVGHAIRRAISVLQSASPARKKIVVAVTNLRCIQWYTVERAWSEDAWDMRSPLVYSRSVEIDSAKRSLAAVFLADPAHLFCQQSHSYVIDGHELEFLEYLGSGVTSTVYMVNYLDEHAALKISKGAFDVRCEKETLELLKGVPGVPSVQGVSSNLKSLLISPVGEKVKGSVPPRARRNFANVIDTLRQAHERKIVHRDVRVGNMLIFYESFLLVDWDFACGVECRDLFCGSLLTASSSVLKDYGNPALYRPKDDLVSFVKSLFLFSHPSEAHQLRQYAQRSSSQFPSSQSQVFQPEKLLEWWDLTLAEANDWLEPLRFAEGLHYVDLKEWVARWAVNYCP